MSLRDVQRPTAVQCACGAVQLSLCNVEKQTVICFECKDTKKFQVSSF